MVIKETLQEKIKKVMQKTGMTVVDLAYATGLPRENMYKWFRGTRPSDSMVYKKLENYLDSVLERIADEPAAEGNPGRFDDLFEKTATLKVPLKAVGKAVPQTNAKAAAGTITVVNNEPQLIVDRIDAPFLGEVEGVIEIIGDSMAPTFKNGCRVAIARLKNPMLLDWGEYYFVIDKNWQGAVRRIYPGELENSIQLLADNENQEKFPPITKKWEQIEAIFKIKAGILKH